MRPVVSGLVLVLAGVVSACGGSSASRSSASPLPQTSVGGATVFQRDCSSCHSLIGNESLHREGGDLIGYTLTRQELLEQTRQMPVPHRLSAGELEAVVDYVEAMQQRMRTGGTAIR